MSAPAYSSPFRCRTLGRAPSPPTWACYEQIPYDDEYSDESASDCEDDDNSCSEDDEEYAHAISREARGEDDEPHDNLAAPASSHSSDEVVGRMDVDDESISEKNELDDPTTVKKDVKGKQRAVEPVPIVETAPPPPPKKLLHVRKRRPQTHALRPILTIQRSQGFVWNQDLFVPPYLKDRYIASTSPPNSSGFISSSVSSTNSFPDYEIDVVEIRVTEGEGYLTGMLH